MISNNEVEARCLPQGQIVHLYSAMAAGLPGRLSPVGLGTFVDPRIEGGRMNARTRERPNLIEHVTFRGDEYLFYPALPLTWSLCAAPMLMKTVTSRPMKR